MEYVDGLTLREVIRPEGPLLANRAAEIGADIAAALHFAHADGVIHRDVKPGNVLITASQVKVTDFGIARAGDPAESLTQAGAVMGTATYFSPEQAQGHVVDPRSDVYSLGVVLYEMVAGRPPFTGENPVAIAYQHVREQPVPPSRNNPDVPGLRRHHRQGHGQEPGQPVPQRRGAAGRPAALHAGPAGVGRAGGRRRRPPAAAPVGADPAAPPSPG